MHIVGALITGAWCWGAGRLLVRDGWIGFASGAATVSTAVLCLGLLGWATPMVFGAAAFATLLASGLLRRPQLVRWRAWVLLFVPFALLYLVNAAAPEISGDGSGYHLGEVRRYFDAGRLTTITTSMYAMFPQGMEVLFWVAYSFGRHSAAALTHLTCLGVLAGAMISYGRRFLSIWVGLGAAMLVFVAPVVGVDASSAYVDIGLAMAGFVSFYALESWDADGRLSVLIAAGLAAGFCFAIKYTGFVAGLYGIGFVLYKARTARSVLIFVAAAAAIAGPWVVRNWVRFENPVAPFYSRLFPNPYIRPEMEEEFRQSMRHFNGASVSWSTPVEITLRGGLLQGTLGPAFLLAPLGLASFRNSRGRRLLIAGAMWAAPWFVNIGTRFLIPALPFAALAMAITLERWKPVLAAVIAIQAIASWPAILKVYCAPYNWRLDRFPVGAALRIEPERDFLERNFAPWFQIADMIQQKSAPGSVIYTAQPIPEAYTDRTIWLDYAAAKPNEARDILRNSESPGAAVTQVRRLGVTHLLVHDGEPLGSKIAASPGAWGLKPAGKAAPLTLYQIEIDTLPNRRNN